VLIFTPRTTTPLAASPLAFGGVPIGQNLGRTLSFADQACLDQDLLGHFGAFRQSREIVEPDELILHPKDIREPALRHAPGERHLAALELGLAAARTMVSGARLDALVALARRLAGARARTTSEPLAVPVRSRGGNQIVQADFLDPSLRFSSHC
jgi:hypothetical protein